MNPQKCWGANSSSYVCLKFFLSIEDRNFSSMVVSHLLSWSCRYFCRLCPEPSCLGMNALYSVESMPCLAGKVLWEFAPLGVCQQVALSRVIFIRQHSLLLQETFATPIHLYQEQSVADHFFPWQNMMPWEHSGSIQQCGPLSAPKLTRKVTSKLKT